MILDLASPSPSYRGGSDNVIIYIVIALLIVIGILITIKYINKKGSDKNEEK